MPDIAKLSVVIDADTSAAEKGLDSFGSKLGGVGGTLATAFGGAAIAGIGALAAGLGAAVVSGADFEKQMSAISAVSGATAEEMESLSSLALQLGADSAFSAKEAAQGIEELVKAGVSLDDVMSGAAKSSLDLAAAGAVSVGEAAELASNAMNVFGLKGSDVAHVADVIAGAANASAISVNDYKFSLSAAGAVAATVGIGFDDLSTAIALMGNAGIKGSDAGTSLKTMLLNLGGTTDKARTQMEQLGIITEDGANRFFTAEGSAKSFAEIAGVLQEATKNLTDQQKIQALQTMFGTDAVRAAAIVAEAGAEGFNELAASIGKVTAEAVAAERLNNLAGAWEQLKGSLETAAITIGLQLMPALTAVTKWATEAVNAIIPKLANIGGSLQDAFGPEIATEIRMTLSDIRVTIDEVLSAIATLTSEHGDEISGAWNRTWKLVLSNALSMTRELTAVIRLFAAVAVGDWETAWIALTTISEEENERQRKQYEAHSQMMHAAIDKFTGGALTATEKWMSDTGKAISDGWNDFVSTTTDGATKILTAITDKWKAVENVTNTVYKAIQNTLTAIWGAIYDNVIKPKLDIIEKAIGTAWEAVQTKTKAVFDPVLTYLRDTIFEPIRAAVETKVNAARDAVSAAWQAVSDKAHAILDPVLAYVRDTVFGPMQAKVESASTGISTAFSTAIGAVKTTVDGALQGVLSVWERTWGAIQRAAESPKQAMQELINFIEQIKRVMPEWLIPHSPTPFQIGLEGIMNAARRMNRTFGDMTSVDGWLRAAMMHTGAPESWLEPLKWIVGHESTGNPNAKNPDSTASGLFQIIDSTWAAYRDKDLPNDVFDPILNAIGGIRYIKSRYGDPFAAVDFWKAHNHYAEGGWAGLNGPELAWLGERGPEYVVPNHALKAGGGGMQTLRVDVAIGGKVARQIVVEGYDLAVRQGWTPGGLTG